MPLFPTDSKPSISAPPKSRLPTFPLLLHVFLSVFNCTTVVQMFGSLSKLKTTSVSLPAGHQITYFTLLGFFATASTMYCISILDVKRKAGRRGGEDLSRVQHTEHSINLAMFSVEAVWVLAGVAVVVGHGEIVGLGAIFGAAVYALGVTIWAAKSDVFDFSRARHTRPSEVVGPAVV